jgi:hypothetical protein
MCKLRVRSDEGVEMKGEVKSGELWERMGENELVRSEE